MKAHKLILSSLFALFSLAAIAQPIDQFTALEGIGEGSIFKCFWGIAGSPGATTGEAYSAQYELKWERDVPHRGDAPMMCEAGTDNAKINSGFGWLEGNHHTKPSAFSGQGHTYVYINGLLYYLTGVKDAKNITSFKIEQIYVLMKPVAGTDLSGKEAQKEMKTRDHEAAIKQYLSDMKGVQDAATASFTDQIRDEIAMREQAKIDRANGIQAKNAAYWNSEEGQRKLAEMRKEDITLVNDTQSELYLCFGSGAYKALKPGESTTFSCNGGKVYRGTLRPNNNSQYDQTDNVLLDRDGNGCGRTVNASTVIR
jgi:hypothetical protein